MKKLFIGTIIIFSFISSVAQFKKDEMTIRKVLDTQVKSWNSGNIDNFWRDIGKMIR